MSLTIRNDKTELEIGNTDTDNEIFISLGNFDGFAVIYINHQDAIEIIKHLKQQFEL